MRFQDYNEMKFHFINPSEFIEGGGQKPQKRGVFPDQTSAVVEGPYREVCFPLRNSLCFSASFCTFCKKCRIGPVQGLFFTVKTGSGSIKIVGNRHFFIFGRRISCRYSGKTFCTTIKPQKKEKKHKKMIGR